MWVSRQDTHFFFPGYVFYKWVFLHRTRSFPEYIFYTCVFLQVSFFTERIFFSGFFYWQVFYTWVFLHNIRLSSPTLDIFYMWVFLQGMFLPGIRLHVRLIQINPLHKIPSPRVDSFYTMGSITERYVGILVRHALFPVIFLHVCFFYKWVFLQSVCLRRSPSTGRFFTLEFFFT